MNLQKRLSPDKENTPREALSPAQNDSGHHAPKTRTQRLVFTVIMVLVMVYCMTVYNAAIAHGLSWGTFLAALRTMWPEVAAAFLAQHFLGAPIAARLLPQIVDPADKRRIMVQVAMAGCMVFVMAPAMTLFVSVMHSGLTADMPLRWLERLAVNIPFAFFIQIFYVGPLVRLIYRSVCRIGVTSR